MARYIFFIVVFFLLSGTHSFIANIHSLRQRSSDVISFLSKSPAPSESEVPVCFYRRPNGRWTQRKELSSLKIGDRLEGWVVEELLDGVTGPKLFLEVGIGSNDGATEWKMRNAMLRLGKRGTKKSVTKKRAARLRKKESFPVFVNKVRLENGQLEVVLNEEDVDRNPETKTSISSLEVGQVLTGTVEDVRDYGCLVDVGASRHGLLHISKVAALYDYYIDKAKGLEEHGLEKRAKIKVIVSERKGKRLLLDFTEDVKEEAALERRMKEEAKEERRANRSNEAVNDEAQSSLSKEDAAAWAAFAEETAVSSSSAGVDDSDDEDDDDDDDDEYDDYDEDRDIEDALGLGTY